MTYSVKEIFYTLQGEGVHTGRAAVFCRFAGCNLWSGLEEDRPKATCKFCDTDFVGTDGTDGGKYKTAEALAAKIGDLWPSSNKGQRFVVCTGGEPLLQIDPALIDALHRKNFFIAIETNGTLDAPAGIDWICVSPKAGANLLLKKGHELKVVIPQENQDPRAFESLDFEHFSVQPMDGPNKVDNLRLATAFCLSYPKWQLSLQTHKILGIR